VLIRYIHIFSDLGSRMKLAAQKRILLEIAIIRLCKPQMEQDYTSLIDRVGELEHKIESGEIVAASPVKSASEQASGASSVAQRAPLPQAIPDDIRQVIKNWKSIISEAGGISRQYLNKAVPSLGNAGELLLVFDDPNAYSYLNEDKAGSMTAFGRLMEERIGKTVEVTLRMNEGGRSANQTVPDLRELINFDIEEENF
jgi:DNA polymerase-3 subunit gamma/tau